MRKFLMAGLVAGTLAAPCTVMALAAVATEDAKLETDVLARKAWLGFRPQPVPAADLEAAGLEGPRFRIAQVTPGGTFERAGAKLGDILVAIGSQQIRGGADARQALEGRIAGQQVEFTVWRDGKLIELAASAAPVPFESFQNAEVVYDAVPFDGGHLRAILAKPKGVKNPKTVYYIQGYTCTTVELRSPNHPIRPFVQQLLDRGLAVWRVEKPAMGDSKSPISCFNSGYDYEVDAFLAGYKHLATRRDVDSEGIFLFGHSMGGLQAPALVEKGASPAGIAVFGTGLKRWRDYLRDVVRYQSTLMGVEDPVNAVANLAAMDNAIQLMFTDHMALADVAKQDPEGMRVLGQIFGWDGGNQLMGRHVTFMQDVDAFNATKAWATVAGARIPVLALAGEVDMAIVSPFDTQMIVRVIDHHAPGLARFEEIAGTNHFMGKVGDHSEMRALRASGGYAAVQYNTNPELARLVADWVEGSISR